jgi:hypothetical protein
MPNKELTTAATETLEDGAIQVEVTRITSRRSVVEPEVRAARSAGRRSSTGV